MSLKKNVQEIYMGQPERIYREFRDGSTAHALTDPSRPRITIYDPDSTEVVASTAPTKESTGVYYYTVDISTASANKAGVYTAYWEGYISSELITGKPHYFEVTRIPQETGESEDLVNSIRRLIGDMDPSNYRIAQRDIWYFIQDAVKDVQASIDFGYTTSVSNTTGLTLNAALTSDAAALIRFRTLILILNSVLFNGLFCAGNVDIGDIRVNISSAMKARQEMLKYLDQEYKRLLYEVKLGNASGYEIDTFVTGYVKNTVIPQVIDVNLGTL